MPVHITPLTPLAFLERSAVVFADRVAVVDGDRRLTYGELAAEVTRAAQRAAAPRGCGPGDRVAYLVPEHDRDALVAHFAAPLAGGVLVAINTRLAPEEVRSICLHSGARMLVADAVAARTPWRPVVDRPGAWGRSCGTASAAATRCPGRPTPSSLARGSDDAAAVDRRRRGRHDLDQLHLGHHRATPRA